VVKQLLGRQEVNPDQPDNGGRTPLSWAAANGRESIIKQILDRVDANPNCPDKNCHHSGVRLQMDIEVQLLEAERLICHAKLPLGSHFQTEGKGHSHRPTERKRNHSIQTGPYSELGVLDLIN